MEEMRLQVAELQKVKEKFITLEHKYDALKFNFAKEMRKNKSMAQQIKALEKDLTFDETLTEIRNILLTNIIDSINDIWSSIQIIFKQIDLVNPALEEVRNTREELGRNLEEEN